MFEVVEHISSLGVFWLKHFPSIDREPIAVVLARKSTHVVAVIARRQTRLLIFVGHGRQEATHNLKVGVQARMIARHFKHAQMQIRAVGSTR